MGRSRRPSRSFGGVRSEATQAQPLQQVLFRDVTASCDATPGPPCGVHGARECAHKFRDEIFMFVVERERRKKDGGGDREEGERERGRRGEEVEEEGGMGGGGGAAAGFPLPLQTARWLRRLQPADYYPGQPIPHNTLTVTIKPR